MDEGLRSDSCRQTVTAIVQSGKEMFPPCITIIMVVFMLCVLVCFPLEKEVRVSAASVIGMQFRERKI